MITAARFRLLEREIRKRGYGPIIDWSEQIEAPVDADDFASRAIYVICGSGMKIAVAQPIFRKCMAVLRKGHSAKTAFGHPGKAAAIDSIWRQREALLDQYRASRTKVEFLATLPWIGPVTKLHLAKNLGADAAKPDVHLVRLANYERTTPARLCRRLARLTGYKIATVDSILWRACADGVLNSQRYEIHGWDAAFAHAEAD